jgi:hypothetical protein
VAKRKHLINLALTAVLVGLLLIVGLDLQREAAEADKTVLAINAEQVQRIQIKRQAHETILLEKQADRWRISEPVQGPANAERITSLLRYLKVPASASFSASDAELARFELKPATLSVAYDDDEIVFGDTNPLSGERYILYKGQVHLVRDGIYHHLISTPTDFINADLLKGRAPLISIKYPGHYIQLQGEKWAAATDTETLTPEAMSTLAGIWPQAHASQVKTLQVEDYLGTVNLVFADLSRLQLDILSVESELILADSKAGVQYHFNVGVVPHLLPELQIEAR